jgi:bromodomain adjacent to zinc finger domain protein 1A
LDRRRQKKESKEKARVMRETEKLERDARRRKAELMKEEMLAKKSVEAIEHKAKRVLEMQDRILSRKKIKYKDKDEEKLGKIAEDLAQTVRAAKEKLERLEKEDAALRRKEDALNKKKRGINDIPQEVFEDTSRPDKPTYVQLRQGDGLIAPANAVPLSQAHAVQFRGRSSQVRGQDARCVGLHPRVP